MQIFNHSMISSKLEEMERQLKAAVLTKFPEIGEMSESIFNGEGKRTRPALLFLCSALCGYKGDEDIILAQGVELIHSATLVHDDIIDGSEMRRGKASANVQWGSGVAVLLGDFIYTNSIRMVLKVRRLDIIDVVSKVTSGMIEGELIQLYSKGLFDITEQEHLEILKLKTANLFSACCRIPAMLSGIEKRKEEALAEFGLNLGIAFQLVDDMLDYSSDQTRLGKPFLKDLREGKITLPLLYIYKSIGKGVVENFLGNEEYIDSHEKEISDLACSTGAIDKTMEKASFYMDKAATALDIFPDGEEKNLLLEMSDLVLQRDR